MEKQPKNKVLYQNPDYKSETKDPYNVRLAPSLISTIKSLAKGGKKTEAEIIASGIHALLMDRPSVAVRAQSVRDMLNQQANELYWLYQDADTMPESEYKLYTLLMKVEGELDQFIPNPTPTEL